MRALIQRTFRSKLFVDGQLISEIPSGLTIFLGISKGDTEEQADYLARKVARLRVFRDDNDKMNLDIKQAGGEILLVSQFSLAGTLGKGTGNRPDFGHAELPDRARELYERVTQKIRDEGIVVKNGVFGAHMEVSLLNNGPVTILLDTEDLKKNPNKKK